MKHRVDRIIEECAAAHGVTVEQIKGRSRKAPIVHARHEAMYLARELGDFSTPAIGWRFNRDHSTVVYGAQKYATVHGLPMSWVQANA